MSVGRGFHVVLDYKVRTRRYPSPLKWYAPWPAPEREVHPDLAGLATSGSGDVLAGIALGLLARGATAEQAGAWAVYLHGEAGNRMTRTAGQIGFLARELLAEIPALMNALARR